jgi:hypothetical protein
MVRLRRIPMRNRRQRLGVAKREGEGETAGEKRGSKARFVGEKERERGITQLAQNGGRRRRA